MAPRTKIDFGYRRIRQLDDITDLVEILFPGNRNQQHAAAHILLEVKRAGRPTASLGALEQHHGVSRRTLERARAKLARLGLIEHVTWMNSRCAGQVGWGLSGRMGTALRRLASEIDRWRNEGRPDRKEKEEMLVGLLRP